MCFRVDVIVRLWDDVIVVLNSSIESGTKGINTYLSLNGSRPLPAPVSLQERDDVTPAHVQEVLIPAHRDSTIVVS